jgi:TRAP-type transport system periplasmic protein
MSKPNRRHFLTSAAWSGAALLAAPHVRAATRAKFQYKYGNNLSLSHPLNIRAAEAVRRIRQATDGDLDIRIFPSNQLGGDTGMLSQLRAGALDFFTPSALAIAPLVSAAPINAVGFAFPDYHSVWSAMDGELGAFIVGEIEKSGLHMMRKVWDNGFRHLTTSRRPVCTPNDLRNLKIRVPVSQLAIGLFAALGAAPTSMQFSEVYTALQIHVVDAQENPLPIIQTAKLYEVQKFVSLTGHIWDGYLFVASGRTWYRLPEDMRRIAETIFNECGLQQRADIARLNDSVRTDLTAKGMVFVKPDPAPFVEVLKRAGFYEQWHRRFGDAAWGRLEKYVGRLG